MTAPPVNRWVDPAWARRYLGERDTIPHRAEGYEVMLELLPEHGGRVLDLGTGDGLTLGLLLEGGRAGSGVGVDFSEEMLGRAAERFTGDDRADIVEHNLDDSLPASLGRFDLVVSSFAIHHCVPDRQRALYGEVFELLVPAGQFVNLEHVASVSPAMHEEFLHAIGKTLAEDDPSNKLVAVETQLGWLRDIGFTEVDCYWKWRELALLAGRKASLLT